MGLNEVFKKVSAINEVTELASHEVVLGALQDIEKELIAASSGAIKSIDMAKAAIKPAQTSLQLNKQLLAKLENFTKQIKDLGITTPQKEVETGITQVKENIQAIDNLIKNLLSI
jgi:hypothetical protein